MNGLLLIVYCLFSFYLENENILKLCVDHKTLGVHLNDHFHIVISNGACVDTASVCVKYAMCMLNQTKQPPATTKTKFISSPTEIK